MATFEINLKEQELINEINNDATLLDFALQYVKRLKRTESIPPCQYSIEDLKDRLKSGRIAEKEGNYKSQEEMRRKHSL